jgi:Ni/Co efflux regulator RcnB
MQRTAIKSGQALATLALGLLLSTGAMAEKPEWAGGGKHGKSEQNDMPGQSNQSAQREGHGRPEQARDGGRMKSSQGNSGRDGGHFDDKQRTVVRNYYSEEYRGGRCPPGLAKKNNGCMPPGQARKWSVGRPLPRDVVYYSMPPAVVVQLGVPPAGHRYVRVASDILLIAIGTGMVVDAMQDLGRQ